MRGHDVGNVEKIMTGYRSFSPKILSSCCFTVFVGWQVKFDCKSIPQQIEGSQVQNYHVRSRN